MSKIAVVKRKGGQIIEGNKWLVLTESTGDKDAGYKHSCGHDVMAANVATALKPGPGVHLQEVPYCPHCEDRPISTAILY
jgi:hypothetical protein